MASCEGSGAQPDRWLCCQICGKQFFVPGTPDKEKAWLQSDGTPPDHTEIKLPSMRQQYRALDGFELTHADVSQIEIRVMAAGGEADDLQAKLDSGDVYSMDAIEAFRLKPPPDVKPGTPPKKWVKSSARKSMKVDRLAYQYGASARTAWLGMLKEDRSIPFTDPKGGTGAVERRVRFVRFNPGVVRYWHREHELVKSRGYSQDWLPESMRQRHYPRQPDPSEIYNWPNQATAAAVMNQAIVEAAALLKTLSRRYQPAFYLPGFHRLPASEMSMMLAAWRNNDPDCDPRAFTARILGQFHDALEVEHLPAQRTEVYEILNLTMGKSRVLTNGRILRLPLEIKTGIFQSDV